jgi:hypothetical protein
MPTLFATPAKCEYQIEAQGDIYIKFVGQRKSISANQFK